MYSVLSSIVLYSLVSASIYLVFVSLVRIITDYMHNR